MRQTILVILAALTLALCAIKAFGGRVLPRSSARAAAVELLNRHEVTGSWTTLEPPADPFFTDVAAAMGVTMIHDNGERGRYRLHEIIGPGVGFVDHDGDGDLDLFVTGGGPLGDDDAAQPCRLYRNDGDRFIDVTEDTNAGVPGHAFGVAVADYDDDGDEDVFVTRAGADVMLRNDGDGRFEQLSAEIGLQGEDNGTSATFLDYDLDGDLDLYVANYVVADDETRCYSILGVRDFCGPTAYPPSRDRLYRNEGGGMLLDVSADAGIAAELGNGLGVIASDFDDDGWVDLYVANDQSPAFFWHNQKDGTFVSSAHLRGCAYDRHGVAIAGMGIASEDFDDDGDFDLIVTNIRSETHLVLQNDAGYFTDTGARMGIGRWSMDMTAFGIVVFDQDNDGGLDAFIANGDVTLGGPAANPDNPFSQPDQFVRLVDGKFIDFTRASGVAHGDVGRAAAAADYDNDGDLDLLVSNNAGPFRLFRNNAAGAAWLMVDARTGLAERTAFNAVISVRANGRRQIREVRPQQSYLSSGDPRVHFGLGDATVVDEVEIEWPDGSRTVRRDVPVDQVLRVVQETPRVMSAPTRAERRRRAAKEKPVRRAARPFTPMEWAALFVVVAGSAYVALGPGASAEPSLLDALSVETTESGQQAVRLDYATWRQACEDGGLPDPSDLDGADPIPVRILLGVADRWIRERDPDAVGQLGQIYQALEEHAAAIQCFAGAVALEPDDALWRYHLGAEAQALGLDDFAVETLTEAARLDPEYPTTHARIGLLHLERQELDAAAAAYERVVALQPDRSLGYVGLGRVALARRANPEAVAHLRRAVAATPNDFLAHRLLARALAGIGDEAGARSEAALAERLPRYQGWLANDERLQASHELANTQRYWTNEMRLAATAGDWSGVIAASEELQRRRPDDVTIVANLAGVYRKLERLDEAERLIRTALRTHPDEVALHSVKAEIALARRDFPALHDALDAALALDDRRARTWEIRGRALFLQGRMREGIDAIQRAVDLDPDKHDARLALGEMLRQVGEFDRAAAEVTRVLREDPANELGTRLLQSIEATRRSAEG